MARTRVAQRSRGRGARISMALATTAVALWVAPGAQAIEPLGTIGQSGVGAGGLAGVQGVGIDGNGRISAAQTAVNRVSEFDRDGNFLHAYGTDVIPGGPANFEVCTAATTCGPGTATGAAGSLSAPWDTGPTPTGDAVYVTEISASRASRFSSAPAFVHAWGYDVIPGGGTGLETCTSATGCQNGTSGISAGQFASPGGVEVLPDGTIAVSNLAGFVSVYGPDGQFVRDMGFPGSGPGQMSSAFSVSSNAAGELAVADAANSRISVFSPSGGFLRAFGYDVIPGGGTGLEVCTVATNCQSGAGGDAAGQLSGPTGVAFAPDGSVYVSENSNNRVSQFAIDGQFVRAFGFDVIPGGPTGFEVCTSATGCKTGTGGAEVGELSTPFGLAVDCRGTVLVADNGNQRLQRFGEPGTRLAPCPSNAFTIGKPKLNKKKGTAKLPVQIPGPGELVLAGAKVKGVVQAPSVAGEAILPIKAKGKPKTKLKKKGKAKVRADVSFTPVNGDLNVQETSIKLKRKAKKADK